ncbi:MAG TPA: hypothetical protein VH482_03335 [Thermomicrobiales bacterium]|jgi:hypothetical protein
MADPMPTVRPRPRPVPLPPPGTGDWRPPRLPVPPTPFFGREHDVEAAVTLLGQPAFACSP